MPKSTHPADLATIEAVKNAAYFTAVLPMEGGNHERHELTTLAQAREAARLLPGARGSSKKALVYAVTVGGRALLVPDSLMDPTQEKPMGALTNLANAIAAPASAVLKNAKAEAEDLSIPTFLKRDPALPQGAPEQPVATPAPPAAELDNRAPDDIARAIKAEAMKRWREWMPSKDGRERVRPGTRSFEKQVREEWIAAGKITKPKTKKSTKTEAPAKAEPKESDVRKTAKTTKASARKGVAPKAKTTAKKPNRYDWSGAEEAANKGVLPKPPAFAADNCIPYRSKIDHVVALAKAGDLKALKAYKVANYNSIVKALDRYRKICIKALSAKKAA